MSDTWFNDMFASNQKTASMDEIINTKISDLADVNRAVSSKKLAKFTEGVRVVSTTNNGLLIPNRLPMAGTKGSVVKVRTASGEVTSMDGEVFVQWDGRGDKIDRVSVNFLRVASMKVASLDDFIVLSGPSLLTAFGASNANATGELVHKSTKDLWSVKVGEDGAFEIERLFDPNGDPLKV